VTAVVTHYERPALARRAIDSLLPQTWPDLRLLVVDDGSRSAEAVALLDELERVDLARPISVVRKPNGGLGSARNAALAAATTELVAFLDDDDEAEPTYIEALATAITTTGASAAAVGFKVFHDVPAGPLEGRQEQLHWMYFSGAPHLAVFDNLIGGAAAMFRRHDALAVGGYHTERQRSFEDWRILVELALSGHKVVSVPAALLRYRVAAQSMLRTFPLRESQRLVRDAYADALPEVLKPWPELLAGLQAEVSELRAEVERLEALASSAGPSAGPSGVTPGGADGLSGNGPSTTGRFVGPVSGLVGRVRRLGRRGPSPRLP
jgi:glycosyltransferase involved in cell wall biosynthesis